MEPLKMLFILLAVNIIYCFAERIQDYRHSNCGSQKFPRIKTDWFHSDGDARFGEAPWMVKIEIHRIFNNQRFIGTLIHPKLVLTVASLVHEERARDLTVYLGHWKHDKAIDGYPVVTRNVTKINLHENFNSRRPHENNAALLYLNEPVSLNDHINTICLPEEDQVFDRVDDCFETSWVNTSFGMSMISIGNSPSIMKKNMMKMTDIEDCKKTTGDYTSNRHVPVVCGTYINDYDICEAWAGSPLVCPIDGRRGRYELVGYTGRELADSRGCKRGTPAGYVQVSKMRDWIDTAARRL